MRGSFNPARRRRTGWVLLGVVVVAVLALAVVLAKKTQAEEAVAAKQAERYVQPTVSAAAPVPIVSAIGDGFTASSSAGSSPSTEWPALSASALDARVVVLAESGMGYVRGGGDNSATTFSSEATTVFPDSKVVLIFGGVADQGSNPAVLLAAARTSYATAKAAAPKASVIAVGPLWETGTPPSSVAEVSSTLQLAARRERVRYVDPIAAGWLEDVPKAFTRGGSALTDSGQRALAARMTALLRPLL